MARDPERNRTGPRASASRGEKGKSRREGIQKGATRGGKGMDRGALEGKILNNLREEGQAPKTRGIQKVTETHA